jgi:hypothetical protein
MIISETPRGRVFADVTSLVGVSRGAETGSAGVMSDPDGSTARSLRSEEGAATMFCGACGTDNPSGHKFFGGAGPRWPGAALHAGS